MIIYFIQLTGESILKEIPYIHPSYIRIHMQPLLQIFFSLVLLPK